MAKLIYCATPSRLSGKLNEVMDFVTNKGYAPLHPFQAFPYEKFEGNPRIGRLESMRFCLKLVSICDEFWMFGVSDGTLQEAVYAIRILKPIRLKLRDFDPGWEKFYADLRQKYGNPLDKFLRGFR